MIMRRKLKQGGVLVASNETIRRDGVLKTLESQLSGTIVHLTENGAPITSGPDILQMLTPGEFETLVSFGRETLYSQGDILICQGDLHDGIHFILSGRVRSFYVSQSGREITLAYWPKGHFVGAPQILGGGEHMWTSIAVEPTTGLWLSGATLKDIIRRTPNLAIALIEGLAYKGMCYAALLQIMGTQSKTSRLGHLLLTMAAPVKGRPNRAIVRQQVTQEELANLIGSSRQSISFSLDKFEKLRLINRDGDRITISDVSGLRVHCD